MDRTSMTARRKELRCKSLGVSTASSQPNLMRGDGIHGRLKCLRCMRAPKALRRIESERGLRVKGV